ncbi:imidazolonepropionase [Mangrovicoccus sp. HB161399]|uniref:imidazolonepropionase n=1 Tax=Mangrovicoccus sp. HB161399 TaxID=2720392 RepID=UPI0015559C8E|nr:imidazolonepropionase [Mangrovicoccus sp. HB161399]
MRRIWTNARVITGLSDEVAPEDLEILTESGRILEVGANLPRDSAEVTDCGGALLTPGLVDCHTHLVHGGDRAFEWEMRLDGATYQEIAQAGGGIASTMRATRALSVDELVDTALPRLDHLLAEGVSTVEIKSGYGLEIEAELNMLRAARRLGQLRPVRVITSWLAAHALPPEYKGRGAEYIDDIAIPGLERAHEEGLADAVDGFCEGIAFSAAELEPLFARAAELGIPVKLHAEQLTHQGGTAFAAGHGALSVDHLEYATPADAAAMAAAGSVAVLLPGAYYMLREEQVPPVAAFRAAGVRMALATDCNPGTSPMTSLLMTMNMGATLYRLTVRECFAATTRHAAAALGLSGETGVITKGASADFALWNAESVAQIANRIGFNPLKARVFKGDFV